MIYVYKAALLCEQCGQDERLALTMEGKTPEDVKDETSYSSDDYPQGPYNEDSNDSDSIQHCDNCGFFLEVPLTSHGLNQFKEAVIQALTTGRVSDSMREHITFYEVDLDSLIEYARQKGKSDVVSVEAGNTT